MLNIHHFNSTLYIYKQEMSSPHLYCKDKSLCLGDFKRRVYQKPIRPRAEGNVAESFFDVPATDGAVRHTLDYH
jgi:hypothetical protein